MKLKLIDNWRTVLKRSWVVRYIGFFGVALPQVWGEVLSDAQRAEVLDLFGLRGLTSLISLLAALAIGIRALRQASLNQPK